jgi:hypothetical protein
MENNGPVEGQIQWQEKIENAKGVEHRRLDGGKKRHTALYVWIPKREIPLAHGLHPDKAKWIKKAGEIPLHQKDFATEGIAEIKESKGEKTQDYR